MDNLLRDASQFESETSASIMAVVYNFLFQAFKQSHQKSQLYLLEMKFARLTRIAVAQAVSQGMLSQSGCVFLSTYLVGIAFEIQGVDKNGNVIVAVSRPYNCQVKPGLVMSGLALAHHSLKKIGNGKSNISALIRRSANIISTLSSGGSPSRPKTPGSAQQGKQDDSHSTATTTYAGSSTKRQKRNISSDNAAKCQEDSSTVHSIQEIEKDNPCLLSSDSQHPSSCRDVVVSSPVTYCDESNTFMENEGINERLKIMFATCKRLLAMGGTGVVLEGMWDGVRAAIKTWNGRRAEDLSALSSEVDMYLHIQETCPSVLGNAVPQFLLGLNPNHKPIGSIYGEDPILVTALVGRKVMRKEDGFVYVGEGPEAKELSPLETFQLREAASKSLKYLHQHVIEHGDIALRNLQVKRYVGRSKWVAWWIDLGNAQVVGEDEFTFRVELTDCENLFS